LLFASGSAYSTEIFVKATKDELKKIPSSVRHQSCKLNISSARFKKFEQDQPMADFLEMELKAKGYQLNFVDYQIKLGVDEWKAGDLVADFSLHIAEKGAYISVSKGSKETYSGQNTLRDYCEVFYHFKKATGTERTENIADLRFTKTSFLNERLACKKALKQALEYVPSCTTL
jgi:hypothetical protein